MLGAADSPVAVVGGEAISADDYVAYLRRYARSKLYHGGSPERLNELAHEALDNIVTDRLLLQEARRRGIPGDAKAVKAQVDGLRERYEGSPEWAEVKQQLPAIGEKLLADSQIAELQETVSKVAAPGSDELQAYYAANPGLFTEPAAWDLDLILIGVLPSALSAEWDEAGEKAAAVFAENKAGRPFGELAAEYSTHGSAATGGKLGRIHAGQLPDAAQKAIESLKPGGVSEPVRVLEGYVIFRLNTRIDARLHTFDSVRDRARKLYERDRAATQWSEFLAKLRAQTPVETFDISSHVQRLAAGQ